MMIKNASFVGSFVDPLNLPSLDLPEIALVGRSNVGKSSLINALANYKNLAYTSKKPGKTITLNAYLFNKEFYIMDLPGYGYARSGASGIQTFSKFSDAYFKKSKNLKGIILLLDSRNRTIDDFQMADYLEHFKLPYIVVGSKVDKLKRNDILKEKHKIIEDFKVDEEKIVMYSSLTHENEEKLLKLLEELLKESL